MVRRLYWCVMLVVSTFNGNMNRSKCTTQEHSAVYSIETYISLNKVDSTKSTSLTFFKIWGYRIFYYVPMGGLYVKKNRHIHWSILLKVTVNLTPKCVSTFVLCFTVSRRYFFIFVRVEPMFISFQNTVAKLWRNLVLCFFLECFYTVSNMINPFMHTVMPNCYYFCGS